MEHFYAFTLLIMGLSTFNGPFIIWNSLYLDFVILVPCKTSLSSLDLGFVLENMLIKEMTHPKGKGLALTPDHFIVYSSYINLPRREIFCDLVSMEVICKGGLWIHEGNPTPHINVKVWHVANCFCVSILSA